MFVVVYGRLTTRTHIRRWYPVTTESVPFWVSQQTDILEGTIEIGRIFFM